jgi:hypothetical protein
VNREQFASTMLLLGVAFDAEITETRMTIYFEALRDLPEEQVLAAMRETIKRCKFFPRVAEIRDLVEESRRRQRDHERATRIAEESRRRRLEVAEWKVDRASRGKLPAPSPIRALLPRLLAEMSPEELEARRETLLEQAGSPKEKAV